MSSTKPIFFLFMLCTIAFYPLLGAPYLYDDAVIIESNQLLGNLSGLGKIWAGWVDHQGEMNGAFRPMFLTVLSFFNWVFGDHLFLYRLVSFLIHSINAFLIFRISQKIFSLNRAWAWVASICFALHPIHGTTLALVWKQSDLWATLFFLLSIDRWFQGEASNTSKDRCLAVFLFPLGLLFKESLLVLPGAWLAMEAFLDHRHRKERLIWIGGAIFASVLYFLNFRSFLPPVSSDFPNPSTPWQYLFTQITEVLSLYLQNIFLPVDLIFDRIIIQHPAKSWFDAPLLFAFLVIAILGLCYGLFLRRSKNAALIALALLWLLPTSSFHALALPYDESRTYLSVGFLLLLLARLLQKTRVLNQLRPYLKVSLSILVLIFLFGFNWIKTQRFRSSENLWRSVVASDPRNPRAHYQLGVLLDQKKAWDEAEEQYRMAIRNSPTLYGARLNLGLVLGRKGDLEASKEHFEILLSAPHPWDDRGLYNLFLYEVYRDNKKGAEEKLRKLRDLKPPHQDLEKAKEIYAETFSTEEER